MKKLICLLLTLVFWCNMVLPVAAVSVIGEDSVASNEYDIDYYAYPITPDSDEWFGYTVLEKVEMLSIPQEILSRMTTDALITAIEEYPYLVDIYLYGTGVSDGIGASRSYFSALNELLSRENGIEELNEYCSAAITEKITSQNVEEVYTSFEFNALLDILNSITEDSVSPAQVRSTISSVLTPKGSSVTAYVFIEEHTRTYHKSLDEDEIVAVYGVTLVEPGSCIYNCHHFAWYMNGDYTNDELSRLWINDPTPYMTDGSYTSVYSGNMNTFAYLTNIKKGDIIFYGDLSGDRNSWHSAIYIADAVTGAGISTQMCISKWGRRGIFKHTMGNVPAAYNTTNISAWRIS